MVATYTDRLRLTKQGDNDNPETWGDVLNEQVIGLLDTAIAGFLEKDVTGSSNVDISSTTVNGGEDDARNMTLKLSGNITTDIDFIVPAQEKIYIVHMTATGGSITFRPTGGTGVTLSTNQLALIYIDGTDAYLVNQQAAGVPSGVIMMWSGSIATIPAGYVLCNGSNGTPDLRDRFIVGARLDETGTAKTNLTGALTTNGGTLNDVSITGTTDSGGSGTTGSTSLTLAQIPSHSHTFTATLVTGSGFAGGGAVSNIQPTVSPVGTYSISGSTSSVGSGQGHTHSLPGHTHDFTGTADVDPPPYYALAFIMKT